MDAMAYNSETRQLAHLASGRSLDRRALLEGVTASALGMGLTLGATAPAAASAFDPKAEAKKIAFDRTGKGDEVLLISGFPQTRRSWNRIVPLLSKDFRTIAADLPSFGDSGVLPAPATTENVGRIFHEFVVGLGSPLHVVAHDFGAWVAYSWALLFPEDFRSLTLIDAGIPGVTLTERHSALRLHAQMEFHLPDASGFAGRAHQRQGRHLCRLVVQEQGLQAGRDCDR